MPHFPRYPPGMFRDPLMSAGLPPGGMDGGFMMTPSAPDPWAAYNFLPRGFGAPGVPGVMADDPGAPSPYETNRKIIRR